MSRLPALGCSPTNPRGTLPLRDLWGRWLSEEPCGAQAQALCCPRACPANKPLSPLSIPQVFAKIFPFQGTARTQFRHTCPQGVPSLGNHEKGRLARLT